MKGSGAGQGGGGPCGRKRHPQEAAPQVGAGTDPPERGGRIVPGARKSTGGHQWPRNPAPEGPARWPTTQCLGLRLGQRSNPPTKVVTKETGQLAGGLGAAQSPLEWQQPAGSWGNLAAEEHCGRLFPVGATPFALLGLTNASCLPPCAFPVGKMW